MYNHVLYMYIKMVYKRITGNWRAVCQTTMSQSGRGKVAGRYQIAGWYRIKLERAGVRR